MTIYLNLCFLFFIFLVVGYRSGRMFGCLVLRLVYLTINGSIPFQCCLCENIGQGVRVQGGFPPPDSFDQNVQEPMIQYDKK